MYPSLKLSEVSTALGETVTDPSYTRGVSPALDAALDEAVLYHITARKFVEIEEQVEQLMRDDTRANANAALRIIIRRDNTLIFRFAMAAAKSLSTE